MTYYIQTICHTFPCKHTVKQFLSLMYFYLLLYKSIVVSTHLNCLDKVRQFEWVPKTHAFKNKISEKNIA